jgi:predicted MFS family arabinose efflux permease
VRSRPGLGIFLVACLALSVGYGLRQSLGLFIIPLEAARGWSAGVFALTFGLQNLVWGIAQPFVGAFADRFGSRWTVASGGVLYAAGIGVMASTANPLVFTWVGGALIGVALAAASFGVLLRPVAALVPPERRTVALGTLGAGGALGQLFYPPFAQASIGSLGWSTTLWILAGLGALILPLAFVLRDPPLAVTKQSVSLFAAYREALAVPSFGLLAFGFFACGFHIAFIQTHLPAIVARAGIAPSIGALALGIVGAFNIIGSFAVGRLADRYPKRYVLAAIYSLRAVAIALFIVVPISAPSVITFSAAMGVLWLSTVAPTSGIIAEKFGLQWVSALFGVAFLSHQIGAFIGAWLGGVIVDRTGSYELMWIVSIVVGIVAALINLPIDERPVPRLATVTV